MKIKLLITLILILTIVGLAGVVAWPSGPDIKIGSFEKKIYIHEGLDLRGGVRISYTADLSKIDPKDYDRALTSLVDVIQKRIDAFGVAEAKVKTRKFAGERGIAVEMPGVTNVDEAINLIGKTAQLDFREQVGGGGAEAGSFEGAGEIFVPSGLTGQHLKKADVTFDQSGNPEISLLFNSEGAKLFGDITKRSVGKPLAIYLDEQIISAPKVNEPITDGKAVITGQFSIAEAKQLAIQLNAGALPVPIKIVQQNKIGATLGVDSIKNSALAGFIGIVLVIIFMIIYYRLPGLLASIALIFYTIIVIAIFKLWPVVLTLAGIAGFILSVGMAVDANILIFERLKEELRSGKALGAAIESGFIRAWSSVWASNFSSLITAAILLIFGSGIIRGFAFTLMIGIVISMFTAIIVTRTFLRLTVNTRIEKYFSWYGVRKDEIAQGENK